MFELWRRAYNILKFKFTYGASYDVENIYIENVGISNHKFWFYIY